MYELYIITGTYKFYFRRNTQSSEGLKSSKRTPIYKKVLLKYLQTGEKDARTPKQIQAVWTKCRTLAELTKLTEWRFGFKCSNTIANLKKNLFRARPWWIHDYVMWCMMKFVSVCLRYFFPFKCHKVTIKSI